MQEIKSLTLKIAFVICNVSNCIAGCAKCASLESQLEMKSEEIRRLKEGIRCYYDLNLMNFIAKEFQKTTDCNV